MTAPATRPSPGGSGTGLPAQAGVGLKAEHVDAVLHDPHDLAFFEVHAENYMGDGGPAHRDLSAVRECWPLSIHGVGLSLGGAARPDADHLARLRRLCDRYEPAIFSEHLAWSSHGGAFYNDLLPLPYDGPTLRRVIAHVNEVQDALGRTMLLENPSTYLGFDVSTMSEVDFLTAVSRATGCGLLLDVNNVYVSAVNAGFDPRAYIAAFPVGRVGEIHLAGFAEDASPGPRLLIDNHGAPVDDAVWDLFRAAIARTGPVPVLIERDNNIPKFAELSREAACAARVMAETVRPARAAAVR
ncbi:MAG: DUF692 domain-containing protein [Alphaproteobacteria bacterium]